MTRPETEQSFGRDGVSGLLTPARAMRARDVSRPTPEDREAAQKAAAEAVAAARKRNPV
jgi:hypothetical protein